MRYQGIILVGIPLISQLIFVAALSSVVFGLENAASKEAHAKRVIASCDQLRLRILSAYMSVASSRVIGNSNDSALTAVRESFQKRLSELTALVKDDKIAGGYVDEYVKSTERILDLLQEAAESYEAGGQRTYTQFATEQEYMEDVSFHLLAMTTQAQNINVHYSPIVEEFQPKAAQARKQLQMVIAIGVAINALIALFLAMSFGRQTVARLDQLMANIKKFSLGQQDLQPIVGVDEIAQLDERFREIAEARNRAEEVRRSIMSMVSHDLRAPLTSLHAGLELGLEGVYGELPPKMERLLKRSNSEIIRLVRLSNSLLDVEKIEAQKVDLSIDEHFVASIVDLSLNAVYGLAEVKQIKISTDFPEELVISCDSDRVIQVLVNLLSNALKFSPRGSSMLLKVSTPGESIRFEVVDEGPGIKPEDQPRVFERFEQLSQPSKLRMEGSGLGLAICKALIEQHSGTIGVISELGKGSTFWFELPLKPTL